MGVRPRVVRAQGAALLGIDAIRVEVEVARATGVPRSAVLGQAEVEVREARERLRVALQAHDLWGRDDEQGVIINLAPAGLRKTGTGLDLPICLAIAALGRTGIDGRLATILAYAEVGLDGALRATRGTLSAALTARASGLSGIIVPPQCASEAAEIDGLDVHACATLGDAVRFLQGREDALARWHRNAATPRSSDVDLAEVKGQKAARRALEVAAAGGHNILLIGPPGSGKTLLSRRLPTILPPLTREESLETTRIHSAAGLVDSGCGLLRERPFRAPHHSTSRAGLVGGGAPPRPGEVSLATGGVLFLDELPEFPRAVLETLRQPLESGAVTIVRASGSARFPARFVLAAAMNPCPCGWHGSTRECRCTPGMIERYRGRLSGPLLDRIDLHVVVPSLTAAELSRAAVGESSTTVRERVLNARRRQQARQSTPAGPRWNARLSTRDLSRHCRLSGRPRALLDQAMQRLQLTARAHDRILKVARTLADLAGRTEIAEPDLAEAVSYRALDRPLT